MTGSQAVAQTPPSGCPYALSNLRPDGAYEALAFEGKRRKDKGGGAVEPNFGPSGAMANSKAARRWGP